MTFDTVDCLRQVSMPFFCYFFVQLKGGVGSDC